MNMTFNNDLKEHLDVIDALRRLSMLVDIFGNNEFIKKNYDI